MKKEAKKCYEVVDQVMSGNTAKIALAATVANIMQGNSEMPGVMARYVAERLMEGTIKLTYAHLKGLKWPDVTDAEEEARRARNVAVALEELSDNARMASEEEHVVAASLLKHVLIHGKEEGEE